MKVIVADTGPLNYLLLIDQAPLLPILFHQVHAPAAVATELKHHRSPSTVREWIAASPEWLVIHPKTDDRAHVGLQSLDEGERQAIKLAMALEAELILMDDRVAVAAARSLGLIVTGTLGVLDLAARLGLIDLVETFEKLRETSFRCHPKLLDAVLAMHGLKS